MSPILLILRWEITAAAVALSYYKSSVKYLFSEKNITITVFLNINIPSDLLGLHLQIFYINTLSLGLERLLSEIWFKM